MEIDRIKFMVASYLRTRLRKIEKHAMHIVANTALSERLSQGELQYAKQYVESSAIRKLSTQFLKLSCARYLTLVQDHYNTLVLAKLPVEHRRLDEDNMSMYIRVGIVVSCLSKFCFSFHCS